MARWSRNRFDGGEVCGALIGDADQQVGTFTGGVFSDGGSGTYTTTDDDTGNWSWAGPAGGPLVAGEERGRAATALNFLEPPRH